VASTTYSSIRSLTNVVAFQHPQHQWYQEDTCTGQQNVHQVITTWPASACMNIYLLAYIRVYCSNLHVIFWLILDSIPRYALKSSFHIEAFLSRRLEIGDIPLGSTPCFSLFLRNLRIKPN
jgi:hypothetical protein